MMRFFTAHVRNGRLILDEPTELPDGTLLKLVSTDDVLSNGGDLLDAEERAELDRDLEASFVDEKAGRLIDAADALAELRGKRSDQDDQAGDDDAAKTRPAKQEKHIMRFINAKIRGGRLTLDEPTELPDGTLVEFVPSDTVVWLVQLDERAPIIEADADQTFDLGSVLAGLRSSHTPSLKARVQNRRLVLDEPTDLPDGTLVEIARLDDVVASGGYCLGTRRKRPWSVFSAVAQ